MKRNLKEIILFLISNKRRNVKEDMPHLCTEATQETCNQATLSHNVRHC